MPTDLKLIVNLTRGTALCESEIADRALRRMRGLLGRDGLDRGRGILLRPAPSIHTAFMRFPIDALFLDPDMRVLGIEAAMGPWRMASRRRAWSVLELAAGEAERRGVRVGDQLSVRDMRGGVTADGRDDVRAPEHIAVGVAGAESTPQGLRVDPPTVRLGDTMRDGVSRIRPLSVLVISTDRRFRSVTSVLIARRGCAVATTESATRLAELAERVSPDVVVIDVDGGSRASTRARSQVEEHPRPLGLVLVDDDPEGVREPDGAQLIAKWGPFERLYEAIEAADADRVRTGGGDGGV